MTQLMTGSQLGPEIMELICGKLGIPSKGLVALDLHINAFDPISIDVRYYVYANGSPLVEDQRFKEVFERFNVVRADG